MAISMSFISFQFWETCDGGHEHRYKTKYHPERFMRRKERKEKVFDQPNDSLIGSERWSKDKNKKTYSSAPTLHHHLPDLSRSIFCGGKTGRDDGRVSRWGVWATMRGRSLIYRQDEMATNLSFFFFFVISVYIVSNSFWKGKRTEAIEWEEVGDEEQGYGEIHSWNTFSVSLLPCPSPLILGLPKIPIQTPPCISSNFRYVSKKTGLEGLDRYSPEQEKVKIHIQR